MKSISIGRFDITFSNRWLYTLIAIGILVIIGVGVNAWANPTTGVGHSHEEIEPCGDNQILQMSGNVWTCIDMSAGGVDWSELSGIPPGFADGIDNTGGGVSCTLTSCANYLTPSSSGGTWTVCPAAKPFMKGLNQKSQLSGGVYVVYINYIQCCAITCS